jgi:phosphatidate cytidylyltransferase
MVAQLDRPTRNRPRGYRHGRCLDVPTSTEACGKSVERRESHLNPKTFERLFGYHTAFDSSITFGISVGLAALLIASPIIIAVLTKIRKTDAKMTHELWLRYATWLVLVPLMLLPILAGAFWTMLAVSCLSIRCYLELVRHTSIREEWMIHGVAIGGIAILQLGALDHWWVLFSAAIPVVACLIAAVAILPDNPQGYLLRIAIPITAFVLFGGGLGHLSYLANDVGYRPMMLLILITVEVNDVFAFMSGKLIGHRRLAPRTSPGKTLGGALGALVLTTGLFVAIGRWVFASGPLHAFHHLIIMGILTSLLGQLGDLMLSSIKRDLGIKDLGAILPGHGGLLDRFDSLMLVAPAIFYYVGYFQGIGLDEPLRIFTA